MKQSWAALCLVLCCAVPFAVLAERDPTQVPRDAALQGLGVDTKTGRGTGEPPSVIVQDGQPRLVVGTRLVAVGQMVGAARLERITETEVWLRTGKVLRKWPRFAGIERTSVAQACTPGETGLRPVATPAPKSKSTKPGPAAEAPATGGCTVKQP